MWNVSASWPHIGQLGEESIFILLTRTGESHLDVDRSHIRFLTAAEQAKVATLFVALYNSFSQ